MDMVTAPTGLCAILRAGERGGERAFPIVAIVHDDAVDAEEERQWYGVIANGAEMYRADRDEQFLRYEMRPQVNFTSVVVPTSNVPSGHRAPHRW